MFITVLLGTISKLALKLNNKLLQYMLYFFSYRCLTVTNEQNEALKVKIFIDVFPNGK